MRRFRRVVPSGEGDGRLRHVSSVSLRFRHVAGLSSLVSEKPKFKTVQEMDIPAIDLSLLLSSSDDGREELRKLYSGLSTWGVVQVMIHGITEALSGKDLRGN
ncbi:BnaCnng64160D [Brassica napus]|uniref:BnaCnng64160D protein n=1 Tax=Brassica napus TaxID=3708 RepID=A0A078JVJ8_BRANA|nr:BnaCnng64160D [Brassica napus]